MTFIRKDYTEYLGREYGRLTVIEILPRKYDKNGRMSKQEVRCRCRCGNTVVVQLAHLRHGYKISCGCYRKPSKRDKNEREPYVIEVLKAKYYCDYTTPACARSEIAHLCCCECDKRSKCGNACQITPDKCGAKGR